MMSRLALALLCALAMFTQAVVAAPKDFDKGPAVDPAVDYYAVLHTSKGVLPVALFADTAPLAVQNFVNLAEGTAEWFDIGTGKTVRRPFFNGLRFHRVIPNFMIQGGDPTGSGLGGPGYKFADEFNPDVRFDRPGLLGMANAGLDDNGSQFFITEAPTPHLNDRHTIFGEVLDPSAMSVVKAISGVARDSNDYPTTPVFIERVEIHRLEKDLTPAQAMTILFAPKAAAEE